MQPDTRLKVGVNHFLSIKYEIKLEFIKLAFIGKLPKELVKFNRKQQRERERERVMIECRCAREDICYRCILDRLNRKEVIKVPFEWNKVSIL